MFLTIENQFILRFALFTTTFVCLIYKFLDKFVLHFGTFTPSLFLSLVLFFGSGFYFSSSFFEKIFCFFYSKNFENFVISVRKRVPFRNSLVLFCISFLYIGVESYYHKIQYIYTLDSFLIKLTIILVAIFRVVVFICLGFYTLFSSELFRKWSQSAYFVTMSQRLDIPANLPSIPQVGGAASMDPINAARVLAGGALAYIAKQGHEVKNDSKGDIKGTQAELQAVAYQRAEEARQAALAKQKAEERYNQIAASTPGGAKAEEGTPSAAAASRWFSSHQRLAEKEAQDEARRQAERLAEARQLAAEAAREETKKRAQVEAIEGQLERGDEIAETISKTNVMLAGIQRTATDLFGGENRFEQKPREYNEDTHRLLKEQRKENLDSVGKKPDSDSDSEAASDVANTIIEEIVFFFGFFKQ